MQFLISISNHIVCTSSGNDTACLHIHATLRTKRWCIHNINTLHLETVLLHLCVTVLLKWVVIMQTISFWKLVILFRFISLQSQCIKYSKSFCWNWTSAHTDEHGRNFWRSVAYCCCSDTKQRGRPFVVSAAVVIQNNLHAVLCE